jgi:hypothetical protein
VPANWPLSAKFCFTSDKQRFLFNGLPFPPPRSFATTPNRSSTIVSQSVSRKSFFARLCGLIAAGGIAPRIFAKWGDGAPATAGTTESSSVTVRPEPRAVPRADGSL